MTVCRVLIVVPTLGRRLDHLRQSLNSVVGQSVPADLTLVAPMTSDMEAVAAQYGARLIPDPGSLPDAINAGMATAAQQHDYVNWLGDDDLLEAGSLAATAAALDAHPHATVAYGSCRYIDGDGRQLWLSQAGPWAARVLSWGPDLIPQPGMMVRRTAWEAVGGLDTTYRFAFDLDLLLRLKKIGPLIATDAITSSFRWHPDSLTVGDRSTNIRESERAKRAALGPLGQRLRWAWEGPVRVATRLAAREVNRRALAVAATQPMSGTRETNDGVA